MNKKKFLAGDIFGTNIKDVDLLIQEDAFRIATKKMRDAGNFVINPFEFCHNLQNDISESKTCIAKMLECDELCLLVGWENSEVCNDMFTLASNYAIHVKKIEGVK